MLGDNPEVSVGPPLQLSWTYFTMKPIDVDAYENHRSAKDHRRGMELALPAYLRRQILLRNQDHTSAEITKRMKEIKIVKSQRDRTIDLLPFAKIEEGAQSAKRKVRRTATRILHKNSDTLSYTTETTVGNRCGDKEVTCSQSGNERDRVVG